MYILYIHIMVAYIIRFLYGLKIIYSGTQYFRFSVFDNVKTFKNSTKDNNCVWTSISNNSYVSWSKCVRWKRRYLFIFFFFTSKSYNMTNNGIFFTIQTSIVGLQNKTGEIFFRLSNNNCSIYAEDRTDDQFETIYFV